MSAPYLALMLLVFLEGPTSTLVGAALAAQGVLRPGMVFLAATVANLLADGFWYAVGRWARTQRNWLPRLERRYPLVRSLTHTFRRRAAAWLLLAKFTFNGVPALLAAGLTQTPWRRLLGVVVLAEIAWIGGLNALGYWGWRHLQGVRTGLRYLGTGGVLLMLFAVTLLARRAAPALSSPPTTDGAATNDLVPAHPTTHLPAQSNAHASTPAPENQ